MLLWMDICWILLIPTRKRYLFHNCKRGFSKWWRLDLLCCLFWSFAAIYFSEEDYLINLVPPCWPVNCPFFPQEYIIYPTFIWNWWCNWYWSIQMIFPVFVFLLTAVAQIEYYHSSLNDLWPTIKCHKI